MRLVLAGKGKDSAEIRIIARRPLVCCTEKASAQATTQVGFGGPPVHILRAVYLSGDVLPFKRRCPDSAIPYLRSKTKKGASFDAPSSRGSRHISAVHTGHAGSTGRVIDRAFGTGHHALFVVAAFGNREGRYQGKGHRSGQDFERHCSFPQVHEYQKG
jgi:hypothetical protein